MTITLFDIIGVFILTIITGIVLSFTIACMLVVFDNTTDWLDKLLRSKIK